MSDNNTELEEQDDAEAADEAADAEEPVDDEPDATDTASEAAEEAEATDADDGEAADADAEAEAEADADDEAEDEEEATPFDDDVMPDDEADLLIPVEDYLGAGVHIGTQQKTHDMERFIHRVRDDGLYVLDVSQTDQRIRTAADFLANYDPEQILVTSSRQYGRFPAEKFAEAIGARARTGRFIPGTLTNPDYAGYIEPDVLVVTDPIGDAQAVKEAITVGIPVIAMCDSNNQVSNVDLVVPTNNKGRRALSVVYWLLANETLDRRNAGTLYELEDFEDAL
ncbi:30S ribosomal protein S2 [Halonotius aquaticus]|uniref:Small ribosomal subunit protein uS2 n=1 Tax=Halonotius aquaticus TaxID=2216978 RepID=A0A3A6Q6U0_9EURY|nr:30S ribosomal protein S2 [Halonotius aquaticus]RJX45128.1 30S ribosomal protein S2 [Halonotius aquaticus]